MVWVVIFAVIAAIGVVFAGYRVLFKPPTGVLKELTERYPSVLFQVNTDERAIALTIDDAPHPSVTPGILDALKEHDAKATFFVIGSHAERYPELLDAIREAGHELANHMYADRMSAQLDSEAFVDALQQTDTLIRPEGDVKWFRPGSGMINDRIIGLAEDNGYRVCLASAYPIDNRVPAGIASRQFMSNVRPGAILVLHDGSQERRQTVRVLAKVLPDLVKRGYRVLTVSELVELGQKIR